MKKQKILEKKFTSSYVTGIDNRPAIESCGINRKTAWVHISVDGTHFSGKVSVTLVKNILRYS